MSATVGKSLSQKSLPSPRGSISRIKSGAQRP